MSVTLFVANVPYPVEDEELFDVFKPFGRILMSRIVRDRETDDSKGYGFVEFSDEEDAKKAKEGLDGFGIRGRRIKVSYAKKKDREREAVNVL